MFDDDSPRPKKTAFTAANLDDLSVEEMAEYIADLEGEIERVRAKIKSREAMKAGADSVFKF